MKRIDGPTPAGGAYSIVHYYDEEGKPTSEEKAARTIVTEFDVEDNPIRETFFAKGKNLSSTESAIPLFADRCPHCGSLCSYRPSSDDPIGISLVRCHHCHNFSRIKRHQEWIQMSSLHKFLAIKKPKSSLFWSILSICICAIIAVSIGPDRLHPLTLIALFPIIFVAVRYFKAMSDVNSAQFLNRYLDSIARTRNAEYRQLLANSGELYDEGLPFGLRFSEDTRSKNKHYLDRQDNKKRIDIPFV